jgi:hypothetical protein
MPSLQTQLVDQNLSVLVIGDDSFVAQFVIQKYQEQSLQTEFLNITNPHFLNRLQELFEGRQIYKTVLVIGFQKINLESWLKALNFLKQTQSPLLFLIRVSTKIQTNLQIAAEWITCLEKQDRLLNQVLQLKNKKKIILGKDVFAENYLHYPFKFFFLADKNEIWLDPGISLTPQTEADFLSVVAQELLRPNERNYIVEGEKINSKKFISNFIPIHQSFYTKKKEIVQVRVESVELNIKSHDVVQVKTQTSWHQVFNVLCRDLPGYQLGIPVQEWLDLKKEIQLQNNRTVNQASPNQSGVQARQADASTIQKKTLHNKQQGFEQKPESLTHAQLSQHISAQSPKDQGIDFVNSNHAKQDPFASSEQVKSEVKKTSTELESVIKKASNTLTESDQLDEKISRLFAQERTKQKTRRRSEKINFLNIIQKKSRHKKVVFWVGLFLASLGTLAGLSLGTLVINYNLAQKRTISNLEAFQQQEFEKIRPSKTLGMQARLMGKLINLNIIEQSQSLVNLNQNLAAGAEKITQSKKLSQQIFSYLLSGADAFQNQNNTTKTQFEDNATPTSNSAIIKALIESKIETDQALKQELSLIQAEITSQQNGYSHLKPDLQKKFEQSEKQLSQLKTKINNSNTINPLLSEILGLNSKKVYYLVIQDDQELRPTGGFLQALASITVENGQIIDERFISVNQLDNKVMGQLNPPPEIESMLGESRLYLRDANWDPDFTASAQKIIWYIREGTNQRVDGLVAVNYHHLKNILQNLGEITVLKYDETVNAANLYDRLQYHAVEEKEQLLEENFQIMLWRTVLFELKRASSETQAAVLSSLTELLSDQQTPLYFSDANLFQSIEQLGWSGQIIKPECPANFGSSCKVDHAYLVEANIGINKVNPHVSRQQSHQIEIGENRVQHKRQIEINNKAHSQVWPLGNYKVYLRFYLNSDAQIESVLIDDNQISADEILEYLDHNRRVVGVVLEVPPQDSKNLTLLYSTPHQIKPGDSYFFFDQAQPGIASRPVFIGLSYPPSFRAELVAPQVEYEQTQVLSNSNSGNAYLIIKFEN